MLESAESNHALFEATLKATQALLALSRSVRGAEALAILQSHFAADAIALKTVVSEGAESPVPALPAVSASALENILGPLLSEEPACGALRPEEQTLLFDEARYPSAIFARFPLGAGRAPSRLRQPRRGALHRRYGHAVLRILGQTLAALLDPAPSGSRER